jgi:hypothetical protein
VTPLLKYAREPTVNPLAIVTPLLKYAFEPTVMPPATVIVEPSGVIVSVFRLLMLFPY